MKYLQNEKNEDSKLFTYNLKFIVSFYAY